MTLGREHLVRLGSSENPNAHAEGRQSAETGRPSVHLSREFNCYEERVRVRRPIPIGDHRWKLAVSRQEPEDGSDKSEDRRPNIEPFFHRAAPVPNPAFLVPCGKVAACPCEATALAYRLQSIRNHTRAQHATLCDPL